MARRTQDDLATNPSPDPFANLAAPSRIDRSGTWSAGPILRGPNPASKGTIPAPSCRLAPMRAHKGRAVASGFRPGHSAVALHALAHGPSGPG